MRIPSLAACLLLASSAQAASLKSAARDLSRAARDAGITRVAVLPFVPADDSAPQEGVVLSERFTTRLVRRGRVSVIERIRLDQVLREQRLGLTGMMDPGTAAKIGRILQADAVVVGTYFALGPEVEAHVRLVKVETARAIAAASFGSKRTIDRRIRAAIPDPEPLDPAAVGLEAWAFQNGVELPRPPSPAWAPKAPLPPAARPSERGSNCAGIKLMIYELNEDIMELKARYWARRFRDPAFDRSLLKTDPAAWILDRNQKRRFMERVTFHQIAKTPPPSTPAEVKRFIRNDRMARDAFIHYSAACAREWGLR